MHEPRLITSEEIIEAQVSRVTYKSPQGHFAILAMDRTDRKEAITAIGPLGDYHKGDRLSLVGRYETHGKYGLQFRVSFANPIPPQDQEAIREYLINAKIKGFGAGRVDRLIERFGDETLQVISEHPERLKEVEGLGQTRIDRLCEVVVSQKNRQETMIFLYDLRLSAIVAARVWGKYQDQTRRVIEENPYQLINHVDYFDFQLADRIARQLGWEAQRIERIQAALTHHLINAQDDGHVCLPRPDLLSRTARFIGSPERCEEALDLNIERGEMISLVERGTPYIYLAELGRLEEESAREVQRLLRQDLPELDYEIEALEKVSGLTLAQAQRDAVRRASQSALLLLTGGPGTGKTTTVKTLIALFETHDLDVKLAAPTGRAARRLSETTQRNAQTIHRLLDYQPQEEDFRRGVDEPLEADVVLIDETSMVDLRLFVALLRALPKRCRLILVGDANQLPSVGPGRVYRDLLHTTHIPTATLTVVFRQAQESQIVANAYQILHGAPLIDVITPSSTARVEDDKELPDFFNIRAKTSAQAAHLIEQLIVDRIPRRFEIKSQDVQIITPMYRGHCGADQLNLRIQGLLNPKGKAVHKTSPLRVGDRVMQLKNYYDKDVYNGDTGLIITRHEEGAVVDFEGRVVNYTKEHLSMLNLAYACSIHKSQGSEYPAVIIPCLEEHWSMLQRDLLYTAVTRGQRLVVLVSMANALERAIRNQRSQDRFSHLCTRLQDLAAKSAQDSASLT